jgi:hypothetical protein
MRRALVVLIVGGLVVWRLRRMHRDEPAPPPPPPPKPVPVVIVDAPPPADAAELPPVARLPVQGQSIIAALVIVDGRLVWTDGAGSIWTMSTRGAEPRELANQHDGPGFPMYQALALHRGTVYAARAGVIATVALPEGPVTPLDWSLGGDDAYDLRSDGTELYGAMFSAHEIARVGSAYARISPMQEGELEADGSDVYAADFYAGMIVKASSTPPRIVAGHIPHPSGFAVRDHAAYAWSQSTGVLYKADLTTGKVSVVSKTWITAGDRLAVDGDWLYTGRQAGDAVELVRVKTDGSELQVLADHISSLGPIAVDADAVYAASNSDGAIVRIDKARVQPLRIVKP